MKRCMLIMLLIVSVVFAQDMIVRVYVHKWEDLQRISPKYNLDIAAGRAGEWYDLVVDNEMLNKVISSGLSYEVTVPSLALQKEQVRASYLSYAETNDSLRQLALNFPSICKLDSFPIPTYQGNWIYGVKISDNPQLEEEDEAGFLVDGLHHSREWACIITVLYFADSMLESYGVVPEITNIINTTEIYCFPIINADGYLYDYPGQYMWRKNREPFGGAIGTDPNRNYPACGPDIAGDWGAVDEGEATHLPSDITFCGPYANSGDETRALTMYVRSHIINVYMSYHSYSELVMWGWCWDDNEQYPDNALHVDKGNHIASMIQRLGGGTYPAGQVPIILYSVSGGSIDWVYSWCHYLAGRSCLSYTTELGTSFYQPQGDLDHICQQNFKALKYLAHFADSVVIVTEGRVPPPDIHELDTVPPNFTTSWHAKNTFDNHPTHWELVEFSNPSVIVDDLESGTGRWLLNGYTWSTAQSHSASHSFFSGNTNSMNSAVSTVHPYLVQPGDSVTFWCSYNLENNYDVSVVEVSENTKEWFNLDTTRFTGNSGGWVRRAYSLGNWVGTSVYIRFRTMYDGGTTSGGFYVDDISPVCLFATVDTIASNITDTTYTFASHGLGDYYYYVRGSNAMWGWGEYSCLDKITVIAAGMPTIPQITKPLDYGRLPDLQPVLSFYSTDPQTDDLQYRVMWDTDPDFGSPDSATTGLYPSGNVVNFTVPSALSNGTTYWWKVKAIDPGGSGFWTSYSTSRSFTIGTSLPASTCTWYQTTERQFDANSFNGTMVQVDSVVLLPSGQTIVDTVLEEHFQSSGIPTGWTVIDGNGDGYEWEVGTTSDMGTYAPPNNGSSYAYYSDDDAGNNVINTNEALISPAIFVPTTADQLDIIYGYGFRRYQTGETYEVKVRFFSSGSWSGWTTLATYTTSVSGTATYDLTSYLPADSVQFQWMYHDESSSSHYGYACACDNVYVRYSYSLSNDQGTMTGVAVPFHELSTTYARTHWGDAVWHKATGQDSIGLQVEYYNGATWQLVPNSVLPGNSNGFFTTLPVDTVDIHMLDTTTYNTLRLVGLFYRDNTEAPDNPALLDWEVGNYSNYIGVEETQHDMTVMPMLRVCPSVFSSRMQIEYALGPVLNSADHALPSLKVYNAAGILVRQWDYDALRYSTRIIWDGTDNMGRQLASGVYFVRLDITAESFVRKIIKVK